MISRAGAGCRAPSTAFSCQPTCGGARAPRGARRDRLRLSLACGTKGGACRCRARSTLEGRAESSQTDSHRRVLVCAPALKASAVRDISNTAAPTLIRPRRAMALASLRQIVLPCADVPCAWGKRSFSAGVTRAAVSARVLLLSGSVRPFEFNLLLLFGRSGTGGICMSIEGHRHPTRRRGEGENPSASTAARAHITRR